MPLQKLIVNLDTPNSFSSYADRLLMSTIYSTLYAVHAKFPVKFCSR